MTLIAGQQRSTWHYCPGRDKLSLLRFMLAYARPHLLEMRQSKLQAVMCPQNLKDHLSDPVHHNILTNWTFGN